MFYFAQQVLPVAQNPSSFRETLASALAFISPDINVHSACCVSAKQIAISIYN